MNETEKQKIIEEEKLRGKIRQEQRKKAVQEFTFAPTAIACLIVLGFIFLMMLPKQ